LSNPALWGLIRAGVWPWSTAVACVVHWRARTGSAGLGKGSSTARAARRPRSSPEHGAGAPRARQGLWDLAQGSRRSGRCSPRSGTVGVVAERGRCRGPAAAAAWMSRTDRRGGAPASGSSRFVSRRCCGGLTGVRAARLSPAARKTSGRRILPEMASGLIPAAAPAEIASRDLEGFPGVGAKLGRSSDGA